MNAEPSSPPTPGALISPELVREGYRNLAGRLDGMSAKREKTRHRIVTAATEVFQDRGFRRASMDEIAEGAGVSRGTLYTYAKSKEHMLLMALGEEGLMQLDNISALVAPSVKPKQRLTRFLAYGVLCFRDMPLSGMMIRGELKLMEIFKGHEAILAAFPNFDKEQMMRQLIRDAGARPLSESEVDAVFNAISAFAMAGPSILDATTNLGQDPELIANRLAELIVAGIGALHAPED